MTGAGTHNRAVWLATSLVIAVPCAIGAAPDGADRPPSFVLRAKRILPVAADLPWTIEDGTIVVRDGVIVAVGTDVAVPPELPVITLPDATVMPGLVAAATDLGGRHTGDESIAAGHRALDAFDRYGNYATVLAGGVTTVHLDPGGHRLLTGTGAVVRLAGPPARRVLRGQSDLCLNFTDATRNPPDHVTYAFPASSDVAITPAQPQRPSSRLGQILALNEALAAALTPIAGAPFSAHAAALADAWRNQMTLRLEADRAADIDQAISFLQARERSGYLVGGAEAHRLAGRLGAAGIPLVYRLGDPVRTPASDLGDRPDVIEPDLRNLASLCDLKLAFTTARGRSPADLRIVAATALRAGLGERRVIEGITRVAAEVLGVAAHVGSLAPGKDADLLVLTGPPLATTTHVQRVYVRGRIVFEPPARGPLVVRAGTIWLGPDKHLRNGAVLIEEGKIVAVGHSVPHPPFARVIDAGPDSFVTPGLIDAHGHLGLRGDRSSASADLRLSRLVGAADVTDLRVARAGVTTVLMAPYGFDGRGSALAAVKTSGNDRAARVIRDPAAVGLNVRGGGRAGSAQPRRGGPRRGGRRPPTAARGGGGMDPAGIKQQLGGVFARAKKYLDDWAKYEKELAAWKKQQKEGKKATTTAPATTQQVRQTEATDPITGTWRAAVTGAPLPGPTSFTFAVTLDGERVEGRVLDPPEVAGRVTGTFDGKRFRGQIEVDIEGLGFPQIDATLDRPDHMEGTIGIDELTIHFEAERIEKKAVEFKVVQRRVRGKDGRPEPPKKDEALEPLRRVLEKKIPVMVNVQTPAQIAAVLEVVTKDYEVLAVLLNAEGARLHAAALAKNGIGVIVPPSVLRTVRNQPYHQGDDLARRGVSVAFQSDAEDGARSLRALALYAVERGLSAEAALAALTVDAARMLAIDDRVGSLAAGKDGDLVIFDGHPLEAGTAVLRVIIDGREVPR